MTIRWFAGDCLSFSQSLQMSFLRVASIFNAVITPYLAHLYGPMTSFYMGIVICFVSVAGAILLLNLDLYYFNKSCLIVSILSLGNGMDLLYGFGFLRKSVIKKGD